MNEWMYFSNFHTIWGVLELIHLLGMAEQSVRSGYGGWWWCYSLESISPDGTWQTLWYYWTFFTVLVTMVFYPSRLWLAQITILKKYSNEFFCYHFIKSIWLSKRFQKNNFVLPFSSFHPILNNLHAHAKFVLSVGSFGHRLHYQAVHQLKFSDW